MTYSSHYIRDLSSLAPYTIRAPGQLALQHDLLLRHRLMGGGVYIIKLHHI